MAFRNIILAGAAAVALAACGQTESASAPDASAPAETAAADAAADVANNAVSGVYTPDPFHRYISFSYVHMGYSKPIVFWRNWTGELNFNADDPAASTVSVVIDATSVDSGVDMFNEHLNSENFFETATYPEITFASTSVTKTGPSTADIVGDLTIKGQTKPVTVHATFNKGEIDERSNAYKIGFSGTAEVKRSDFGVDLYVPYVSDEVEVTIEAEWLMPLPETE